jgi:hypothetical protein
LFVVAEITEITEYTEYTVANIWDLGMGGGEKKTTRRNPRRV